MQKFSYNPLLLLKSIISHRELLIALTKREVIGRYKGSIFGLFWSFVNPLFMLAIYTFVFSYIFKARWDIAMESQGSFALILFIGLMIFNLFAECVGSSAGLIIANTNYVKKVVFPLEILPWISLGNALFHFSISLLVWLIASFFVFQSITINIFLIPIILLPFILLVLGLSMLISALGVYIRDIGQFITLLVTAMMFLSPIFFPISAIPDSLQHIILFNPLSIPIIELRKVLIFNQATNWQLLFAYFIVSIAVFSLCFALFQKMRRGFSDVL